MKFEFTESDRATEITLNPETAEASERFEQWMNNHAERQMEERV